MSWSTFKQFTRGGQTFSHDLTMFNQIANKVIFISSIIFPIMFALFFLKNTSQYDRYLTTKWFGASVASSFGNDRPSEIKLPNQKVIQIKSSEILRSAFVNDSVANIKKDGLYSFGESFLIYSFVFLVIAKKLKKRGNNQSEAKVVRGMPLTDKKDLLKTLKKKDRLSPYTLAGVPLPYGSESQHIQITGTTGSGKTVAIRELLKTIRARGDRAIIYDKGGTYLSRFYDESKDYILNPLDERGMAWDIWQECHDKADFESMADALMPMPISNSTDPFWVNAARMIFVSSAYELSKREDRSNLALLQYLLTRDMGDVHELIKHTESESLVSEKVEKTALNVKAVMATYLKSLAYLKSKGDFFSIRKWIESDNDSGWLFISSDGRKHATLRPLISAWINTAAKEVLSLKESESRRIWIIFDELATLHALPFIELSASETRKFGGCFLLGYHGASQLRKIYGTDGFSTLENFCSTQLYLRLNNHVNAKWVSNNLGTYEIEEVNESISYGANSVRDGITISRQIKERHVALPSEITQLEDLEGFLKLKGGLPVAKVAMKYVAYPTKHEGFIPREDEPDSLSKEVNKLIEKYEDPILASDHDRALKDDDKDKEKDNEKVSSREKSTDLSKENKIMFLE